MERTFQFSLDRIDAAARWFWNQLGAARVVALHGAMGAGKTTFVHALCQVKGVQDAVTSPTFSLINEYLMSAGSRISHMDLYRIRDEEEAREAGIEEVLYAGGICLVEWPEKAPGIFPPDTLHASITISEDQERLITISS